MTNFEKATEVMNEIAELLDIKVVALVLENEEEAIVAASNKRGLIMAKELIEVSLDNLPEEDEEESSEEEEECMCDGCLKHDYKFFDLVGDAFPSVLDSMPDEIKKDLVVKLKNTSKQKQTKMFEKMFPVLKTMSKIMG